ncbi:Uma2 family endonuclease [Nocardiopsis mwathae]|uniref:Uma2 family endonuclease n=1 Tax=Nocardiopsis mwathae TaxID=1472723 RepID=A0A7W9YGB4_9ACTN|nr:Uma2 family endonuclease [Nocardiopsis mwathae]
MSRTPVPLHNWIVTRFMHQLLQQLPADKSPQSVTSVGVSKEESEDEDYAIPDLVVLPADVAKSAAGWLVPADCAELALEVVSRGSSTTGTDAKPSAYADWEIAIYVLVDPRDGTIVLYADPRDGKYQNVHRMKFGDTVVLPEPLKDIRLETEELSTYG